MTVTKWWRTFLSRCHISERPACFRHLLSICHLNVAAIISAAIQSDPRPTCRPARSGSTSPPPTRPWRSSNPSAASTMSSTTRSRRSGRTCEIISTFCVHPLPSVVVATLIFPQTPVTIISVVCSRESPTSLITYLNPFHKLSDGKLLLLVGLLRKYCVVIKTTSKKQLFVMSQRAQNTHNDPVFPLRQSDGGTVVFLLVKTTVYHILSHLFIQYCSQYFTVHWSFSVVSFW